MQKPHYAKETEKAVAFEIEMEISEHYTDKYKKFKWNIWCPKSCLNENGYPLEWFWSKKIRELFEEKNPFSHWNGGIVEYDYNVLNNPDFKTTQKKTEAEEKAHNAEVERRRKEFEATQKKHLESAQKYREMLVNAIKQKNPKYKKSANQRIRNTTFEADAKELGIDYNAIAKEVGYIRKEWDSREKTYNRVWE